MFLEEKKSGEKTTPTVRGPLELWQHIVLDAADYIERSGWVQEVEHDGRRVCVMGALNRVCRDRDGYRDRDGGYLNSKCLVEDVRTHIRDHVGMGVTYWNDLPGQTVENVLQTLRSIVE